MTGKEFEALFTIYAKHNGLSLKMQEAALNYCKSRYQEIEQIDQVSEFFDFLENLVNTIIVDLSEETDEIKSMTVFTGTYSWGKLMIIVLSEKVSPELRVKFEACFDTFTESLITHFREYGIDLAMLCGLEDPKDAEIFKKLIKKALPQSDKES